MLGAPPDLDGVLGTLPAGVRIRRRAGGSADLVLLFVRTRAELDRRFPPAARTIADGGSMLWIVWPKKSSRVASDLTQPRVREYGLARGLVDYKVASIDTIWTGLRFARRKESRR